MVNIRCTFCCVAAHGVGCPAAGLNLETGQLSRHDIAEILLNVMLNHNKPNQNQNLIHNMKHKTSKPIEKINQSDSPLQFGYQSLYILHHRSIYIQVVYVDCYRCSIFMVF